MGALLWVVKFLLKLAKPFLKVALLESIMEAFGINEEAVYEEFNDPTSAEVTTEG